MISRADSEGWTDAGATGAGLSHGESGGFDVDTDELARIARVLAHATEILLRAEETGRTGAAVVVNEVRAAVTRPVLVPGWLRDYDRSWRALRDGVLHAHGQAARALREAARAYLDSESRAVQLLAVAGAADPSLSPPDRGQPPRPASSTAADVGFPNSVDAAGHAGGRPAVDGDDLDNAIELWRRRRDSAAAAAEVLRQELTDLRWHGPAAAAFRSWTHAHLDRCTALADHAEIAHAALTRAGPTAPRTMDDAPELMALLAFPTDHATGPARPGGSPIPVARADPPSTASPASPQIETATPAAGSIGTPPGSTSETDPTTAATSSAPSPGDEHLDDEDLELADADPAPNQPAAEPRSAVPVHDPPADDEHAQHTAGRHDVPTTAVATTLPVAAIATTALFARTDRAHHVIRDIALPPATSGPAPQPGTTARPSTDPTAPLDRGPHPATGPRPHGDSAPRGNIAPRDEPWPLGRPMPPDPDTPSSVWINLARAHDPPAWIDLTATRGLGLDGPGAPDIARTIWRRLHDHHPHAMLITPEALALHLLGSTTRLDTEDRGVCLVRDPRQGLQAVRDEIERRRTTGLLPAPVVLIAPTPTTVSARSDLTQALQQFPPAAVAAVLLGHWHTGTTLTVTEHHRVGDHHRPAPGRPPLTGARLEPTTPDLLSAPNPPMSYQPSTDDHDPTAAEHPDLAESAEPRAERTPLALSVLGPVQLRYRRPTTGNQSTEADRPRSEEVLAVPGISRPARELLAYLAAHPGGATRDAIIEALWPNSAADRPDTAFHTTISRLRKRLRDATGTDATGDVITTSDGRWHLNRAHVTVDYWTFLETHPRNPDPTLRRRDHHIAVQLYQGPFAADSTGEWTHTIREATRRRYLEAINDLTETEIAINPDLALDLLERARNLEPLNEAIYRNIMRIHLNSRRHAAARGVYELLRTHLATIEATPDPESEQLAAALRN